MNAFDRIVRTGPVYNPYLPPEDAPFMLEIYRDGSTSRSGFMTREQAERFQAFYHKAYPNHGSQVFRNRQGKVA